MTTPWLRDENAQGVCRAIMADGGRIYFVGGCVRDALLKVGGSDIDLATDVLPDEVTRLAQAAGFRVVPTGFDHGTVTVVAGGKGFEVTTFRQDVSTDGRRATVAFSTDISADARRRDFTLNALYAQPDGLIVDPLGGVEDCLNRRIRFIEDADRRIREDYLRILRYFRFHAWYAQVGDGFDSDALDAIARNSDGLETLSAERVGHEVVRLLKAPDPTPAIAAMRQAGCLTRVLPGSDDRFLAPVVHLEQTLDEAPDPMLRLAALGGQDVPKRLRLSRADTRRLELLRAVGFDATPLPELAYRQGADIARRAAILRAAFAGQPLARQSLVPLNRAATAVLPIGAKDLMPSYQGKALGARLAALETRWIASGFTLSRDDLLRDA
ncbi:CCA tRNA nucleotidyltransferase [Roseobacter weihaiensis]|uniref:CCA tRNA nucleotidyltransferase n=1 Tax=Roseobacter weihaiensis TaxID=2763262 RepID=UPI001D0B1D8A|nr:CCA tRNA nucleotidyltransferase [Roseobacter sp. H9]